MKLMYGEIEVGRAMVNHSVTIKEAIMYCAGYDITSKYDREKAYEDGFPAAYIDDLGQYQIDIEGLEMIY